MGRAPCCDKANVKRGPWSPEEDATLRSFIEKNGTGGNWIAFPQKAGLKRCGKSCRLRWLNYLRPDIKHGGFTEEEDNIIFTLYDRLGSRWSVIASHLPGRTDNDVKNYWNTKLKKKLMAKATNSTGHIPRPTPPPLLPPPTAIKTESFAEFDFSLPLQPNYCLPVQQPPQKLFPYPTMAGLTDQPPPLPEVVVSPSSSTVTVENSSGSSGSYLDWSTNSNDHLFLSALGFGDADGDLLGGYEYQELNPGELAALGYLNNAHHGIPYS
ncbi:hypothetical protein Cni_G07266 [Canna indica]|uniref:Uncharacterized protein n=1 Tax=Canna indica TaxID=4628 RepID=A0AAQ3JY65_9LILI|nr:hypothetical protein Cni_G07266 [Canna indica]